MIHGSSKAAPLVCVSRSLPSSEDNSWCLQYLVWWHGKLQRRQNRKKKNTCTTEHTVYSMTIWQKWTIHQSFGLIRTACCGQSTSSLADADRSQLFTGGDLCCCSCILVFPKVCLNGVVSPPICAFCCCPLLPKNRQIEMTIGELCCLVILPDLGLGNKIFPLICARGAFCNHFFLFLRGSWSLLWAVLPVPMTPHRIIGVHCYWGCRRWKMITSLENHFKSGR